MTYRELLKEGINLLCERGITEYENNAWLLFEYVFDMKRHQYFMKMNDSVADDRAVVRFRECVARRAEHIPVQYITGTQDFMGLTFKVNENVLIPRQDTEILVENVLKVVKQMRSVSAREIDVLHSLQMAHEQKKPAGDKVCNSDRCENIRILDMCTGSGCIAISVSRLENVEATAVDISENALKVAKENAKKLGADRVNFIQSDLFEKINMNNGVEQSQRYDIIVSNPPYIPTKVVDGLLPEVREHEPRLALDGTDDGLEFYRRITEESVKYVKENGWLMYEIGCEQGEAVKKLMMDKGYEEVNIIKDLAGLDRVVAGILKKSTKKG